MSGTSVIRSRFEYFTSTLIYIAGTRVRERERERAGERVLGFRPPALAVREALEAKRVSERFNRLVKSWEALPASEPI